MDIGVRGKQFSKLMTDKEKIISMLKEFASPTKMASFFVNNATSDFYSLDQVVTLLMQKDLKK